MLKKRYIFPIIILLVILSLAMNMYIARLKYKHWIYEYLSERYHENMQIKDIYTDQWGLCAKVVPTDNPELAFEIKSKYSDTYLESALEYEAEKSIKNMFPQYIIVAQMNGYESIETPFPELYQLYENYNRPANWIEIPEYIRLERLRIYTNEPIDNEAIEYIVNCVLLSDFRTSIIELYDGKELYSFQFNMSNNTFEKK